MRPGSRERLQRPSPSEDHRDQLLSGVDVALTDPQQLDARAPVETQNATSARSRNDGNSANSSLNFSSGMLRGTRWGRRGRNCPDRWTRERSIGLRWVFAPHPLRPRANWNGLTIGPVPASRWKS
jgi:hypothetical protein